MWDIRYLLMDSKLGKIPGFPAELKEIRGKVPYLGTATLSGIVEWVVFEML